MMGKKHGGRLHKTGRKKMLREPKNTGMADKKRQVASAKRKRFRMKNRDDGEKTRRTPAQDWQKKMLRKPKNTGMTDKNTANSIHKTQKIPEKNRDDGEKTRRAPAQDRQKKMLREPKNTGMTNKKNGKQHPQNAKDSG